MAAPGPVLLLLCTLYAGCVSARAACNVSAFAPQLDALLAEYARDAPPAVPVLVRLALRVRHAALVDADQTLRVLADLSLNWSEPRLTWNASEWGCDSTLAAVGRLWLPDVEAVNAAAASVGGGAWGGLRARVSAAGEVAATARLELRAPLRLELAAWPADTQQATLRFASRAHSDQEIQLEIAENKYEIWESGAWQVVSVQAGAGQDAAWVEWRLRLARRAAGALAAARACLCGVLLLLLGALLAPDAARAPLAAAAAFVSALWLCSAAGGAGGAGSAGGADCPRLVRLQGAACALAAASCAGAGMSRALRRRRRPAPSALRDALLLLARWLPLLPNEKASPPAADGSSGGSGGGGAQGRVEWAAAARLLDWLGALLLAALALSAAVMAV